MQILHYSVEAQFLLLKGSSGAAAFVIHSRAMQNSRLLLLLLCAAPVVLTAQSAPHGVLLVTNQTSQNLSIIDPVAEKQIAAVPESGYTGHEVAASPDGKLAFVPIYGNSGVGKPGTDGSTMDVVDIASRKVVKTVDFGHGVRPHKAIYDPNSKLLYVTSQLAPPSLGCARDTPPGRAAPPGQAACLLRKGTG